jgi:hypothetical protein
LQRGEAANKAASLPDPFTQKRLYMKRWLNKILTLLVLPLVLLSCDKDEERVVVRQGAAPTLSATATTLELNSSAANQEAITFSWTPMDLTWSHPEYKYSGAVNYSLQIDRAGNNFASPIEVDLGRGQERKYTVGELNAILVDQVELTPFASEDIEVRLKTVIGPNVEPVFSNALSLSVTPYADVKFAPVYMVGSATEFEWDNTKATPMFYTEEAPFHHTYTGYLKAGALKFLTNLGQWAPQYGNDGSGGVAFRATEADPDPGVFDVPADGYYTVNLDIARLTFSIEPFDATTATTHPSIGIIGPFTDWSSIVPMAKSSLNTHLWSLEHTFAEDTEMKFRIAEDWSVNWGPADNPDRVFGRGVQNGLNLTVAQGTYTIYFNDLTGHYVLIKK